MLHDCSTDYLDTAIGLRHGLMATYRHERSMLIDAVAPLYSLFQMYRHAGVRTSGRGADAVHSILQAVRRTRRLEVDIDIADPEVAQAIASLESPVPCTSGMSTITEANQPILDVITCAVDDLRKLATAGEQLALRNLGYAFHPLPELLRDPTRFDRDLYTFSLRFVAFHWSQLSPELHLALARMLDVESAQLEEVVGREGFASSMYRRDPVTGKVC